ncbi:MOSC domain-containing protein [Trujillonella humicola]|uniref:MOSC domain-containing protein n=1 Tax=Trujillonella humicola TaxID=3383699 RepID=UPI0039067CBA
MRVAELWRFPVKSLQGQRVDAAEVGPEGLAGDRRWALFDTSTGMGLTARRVPDLLFASGRLTADGGVEVVLPDGTATTDDAVLSAWLGRPVTLRASGEVTGARCYENPVGVGDDGREYDWDSFDGARGAFHDSSRTRVSLVSAATLGSWDRRRFRANVVLDGAGEDELVGRRVRLGGAELDVVAPVPRCVMVTRPQPGGIGRDTSVLKTVHRERGGDLAVAALVAVPGVVAVGDELTVAAG